MEIKRIIKKSIKTECYSVPSGNILAPKLLFIIVVKFRGNCVIQHNIYLTHRNAVNLSIVYNLSTW